MCTRVDPHVDTDFIRRAWSGPLDPAIPKDQKGFSSRAIIDATMVAIWTFRSRQNASFVCRQVRTGQIRISNVQKFDLVVLSGLLRAGVRICRIAHQNPLAKKITLLKSLDEEIRSVRSGSW
jgi:hypothetical protein